MKTGLVDRVFPALAIGAGVGLLCFILRIPAGRSIGLGVTGTGLALIFLTVGSSLAGVRRPAPPPTAPRRSTAPRWEIDRFDQLFGRPPYLAESTRERLHLLVDTELHRRGSSFHQARADGSLGAGPWELLAERSDRLPSRTQLTELAASIRRVVPPDLPLNDPPVPPAQGAPRP